MIQLTDAQVLAAAAPDRLVNIISAPGSGKTTIAAERYGYLRYQTSDLRGVLGLTFNRAAATELRERINRRWGANCIRPAHRVITFDHLHVDILTHLLSEGQLTWPGGITTLEVRDDYRGLAGFRFQGWRLQAVCFRRQQSFCGVGQPKSRNTLHGNRQQERPPSRPKLGNRQPRGCSFNSPYGHAYRRNTESLS